MYQRNRVGMKEWEKTFPGCRKGSGDTDHILLFFTDSIPYLSDHLLNQAAILLKQQPRSYAELSENTGCRQTLQFSCLVA